MSSKTVIEYNHAIVSPLFDTIINDVNQLKDAINHRWYANKIIEYNLLSYLAYAPQETVVEAMHALFYAFSHSGTREGLCQLCLGLFGRDATIIIDDEPNTVSITIQNANRNFDFAVADETLTVASSHHAVAATSLQSIVGSNPSQFFKQFLPAGVILTSLKIDQ